MSISPLHYRVLELSKRHRLGHLSSNLTAVDIIDEIYTTKRPQDIFVLSAGHAGLALYVNLEKHEGQDAETLYLRNRTHPHRDVASGIQASAGSLGCGITIALGLAMGDRSRDVHVLITDGESWEPDVSGVLNLKTKFKVDNLIIHANVNGFSCVEKSWLAPTVLAWHFANEGGLRFHDTSYLYAGTYGRYPFLKGVEGHYHQLTDQDWAWVEAKHGLNQTGVNDGWTGGFAIGHQT